jgi:ABC-2 type transport system ATP-binding protein
VHDLVREGATVFLSSHVLAEVERLCHRIALIRRGRLVEVQSLDELQRRATRRVIVDFSRPVAAPDYSRPGALVVQCEPTRWVLDISGPMGAFVSELAGLPVADLQVKAFTLRDYILEHYADATSNASLTRQ